ncbi:MAG: hypothetical protein NZV14_11505 [Bryobacteraceae bacterium]|nr:hypothetical protein [Bryobacteraceae bacterium]MDW8378780.1 hypothetical protein [Bryobacterales bacterium]
MSIPPLPPSLESLGRRPFSFYPPVVNIEHNEWVYQRATWSEILVLNTKTQEEVWVPRRFLGEVSKVDEPVMIVGLKRELEYKAGALWPHERRVIEMPRAVNDLPPSPTEPQAAPKPRNVTGIRLNDGAESRIGKLIVAALVLGVLVTFGVVSFFRARTDPSRVTFVPILQQTIGLTAQDKYHDVVRKLGQPTEDYWKSDIGELQYRVLRYKDKGWYVILMGSDREEARYIGTMNENWKPIDATDPRTRAMLNGLPRF